MPWPDTQDKGQSVNGLLFNLAHSDLRGYVAIKGSYCDGEDIPLGSQQMALLHSMPTCPEFFKGLTSLFCKSRKLCRSLSWLLFFVYTVHFFCASSVTDRQKLYFNFVGRILNWAKDKTLLNFGTVI